MKFKDWLTESKKEVRGFHGDIEKQSLENKDFRKVLYTAKHSQLVVMNLKAGEEIGEEVHPNDQFFRVERGNGKCVINGNEYSIKNGDAIIVPAGAKHNIINNGNKDLKMYTIYSPPHHKDGTVHKTKKDAEKDKEKFDGDLTETCSIT